MPPKGIRMKHRNVLTALLVAAMALAVPSAFAERGGNGGGNGGNGGGNGELTISASASWEPGWVIYDVTRSGGGDPLVIVHHSCYEGGQLVYEYAKGVSWTDHGVGNTNFVLAGDTCSAYAETSGGSNSRVSNAVTYSVADMT